VRYLLILFMWSSLSPSKAACVQVNDLSPSPPPDAFEATIVARGINIGKDFVWIGTEGATYIAEKYGVGLVKQSRYLFDSEKIPLRIDINALEEGAQEHFSIVNKRASWRSAAEVGSADTAHKFFVSRYGTPVEKALLAGALLKNSGMLELLPSGTATIKRIQELDVHATDKTQRVYLYAISGLDFTPVYVWLTASGDFFAEGDRYYMTIQRGYESSIPSINSAQDEARFNYLHTLNEKLSHRPEGDLIFQNIAVFDSQNGKTLKGRTVVISGNRISSISRNRTQKWSATATIIDGTGKTLLPGLWDMHQHVSGNEPLLDIAAGVTTVRDLGNINDLLTARRRSIDEGEEIGPRIIPAGFIDGAGPGSGSYGLRVASDAEARHAVTEYADQGYRQIKIYGSLNPQLVPVVIDEAHKRGIRVSGHIPAGMTAAECVRLGFDEIQHMYFVFLNFMPDVKKTNTRERFTAPAERAADIDLSSAEVKQFLALLKSHQVAIDPTLNIINDMLTGSPREVEPTAAPIANRLPGQVLRTLMGDGLPNAEQHTERYARSFAAMKKMLKMLYGQGIQIVAGTDSPLGGFALDAELELYERSGIPAKDVLRIATLEAARVMKQDRQLGSVSPGKLADVIVVDGDPSHHISEIRKVSLVVKNGIVYDSREIEHQIGMNSRPELERNTPPTSAPDRYHEREKKIRSSTGIEGRDEKFDENIVAPLSHSHAKRAVPAWDRPFAFRYFRF